MNFGTKERWSRSFPRRIIVEVSSNLLLIRCIIALSTVNLYKEFDNFGAIEFRSLGALTQLIALSTVMAVSEDLLCAFELLKPLDGPALKKELRTYGLPAAYSR